jgi:hypothetical protein
MDGETPLSLLLPAAYVYREEAGEGTIDSGAQACVSHLDTLEEGRRVRGVETETGGGIVLRQRICPARHQGADSNSVPLQPFGISFRAVVTLFRTR